ncbi:MAG: FtsB family cell division protein [Candidatus Nanopelagicaceae bacterium]
MPRKRSSYRRKRVDKATRFLMVASFFFGAIILIGSPLQKYFAQRAQINALQTQVDSSRKALEEARKELELWNDPNYIKSQARARLHYVLPGERQYILTNDITLEGEDNSNDVATNVPTGVPWYTRLIATVTEAGIK